MPGITTGPMRTRSSSITTGRWLTRWRRGLVEHRSRRFAAADHEQEVGVGSVERPDAEVGEGMADGECQGTAAGHADRLSDLTKPSQPSALKKTVDAVVK